MTENFNPVLFAILERKPQFVDRVKSLLANGMNPNEKDGMDITPLHHAVCDPEFSKELTEALLSFGAHVHAKDCFNDTALHRAMRSKGDNAAAIKLLLESGANVNARNSTGVTPLLIAAENMNCGPNILRELLLHVSDLNIQDNDLSLPLLNAVKNTGILIDESYKLKTELNTSNHLKVKVLLDFGCRVDTRDETGKTLLHVAAMQSMPNIETIKLLVESGICVNAVDNENQTVLHMLMKKARVKDILTMIELGADVNAKNSISMTPLHCLLECFHPTYMDVFELMMAKGADPNIKTLKGCNALHIVLSPSYFSFCDPSEPYVARVIRVLVSYGADINCKNNESLTPLALAISYLLLNVLTLRELIRSGADVNFRCGDPPIPLIHYTVTRIPQLLIHNDLENRSMFVKLQLIEERIYNYMKVLHLLFDLGAMMGSQCHCVETLIFVLRQCLKFGDSEIIHKMWYEIMHTLLNNGAFLIINQGSRERVFKNMISGIQRDFTFEKEQLQLCQLFIKFFVLHSNNRKTNGILLKLLAFEPRLLLYANKCIAEIKLMDELFFSHTKPMFKKYCDRSRRGMSFQSLLLHLLCVKVEEKCCFELIEFLYLYYDKMEVFGSLFLSKLSFKQLQKFVLAEKMLLPVPGFFEGCAQKMPSHSCTKLPEIIIAHVVDLLSVEDIRNYILAFRMARKGQLIDGRNSERKFEETEENLGRSKFLKRQRTF